MFVALIIGSQKHDETSKDKIIIGEWNLWDVEFYNNILEYYWLECKVLLIGESN